EELLAEIWARALGVERVGVDENFFGLGGHSLLATQVVSRARQVFEVEVPLKALFEEPTVAGLARRIEALRSAGALPAPPIERVPRSGPLPLSYAQQRLWLVDRLEPGSVAYNMLYALHLRGALDVAALRATLAELVRRHEVLRTTFAERDGAPVQVVHEPAPVPLPVVDLRGAADPERTAEALVEAEAMRPFDLGRGPLLRSTLLRLGDTHHALCFTMHHIVSDGWSRSVLTHEVSALYAQFSRGGAARLPEPPVQYADYAVWQRGWLVGDVLDGQIEYWKTRLAGAPPLLEVPTDRPRAAGQSPLAASHRFALSPELSSRLRALSRQEGATLFMTLLAGWQALLGRYSGQEDLVVGSPIAGRTRPEVERLIGFFVNLLALRADLSGDPTWTGLLERVRGELLRAYEHQDLPFDRLVEELGVERSLAYAPVFQNHFTLNLPFGSGGRLELGSLGIEPFGGADPVSKFDLDLVFTDGGETLGARLVYRRELFDAATGARMAEHLTALLESMAADPARRLSELSLLRGAERAQVLEAWNDTAAACPRAAFHQLFAEQAARTPELTAATSAGAALTYAELERESNRLAHHLRRRGVGPETRVGLCLERGVELLVGVLGVLKAGGAYVPLDPAYPAERLARMLAGSAAPVVVTRTELTEALPGYSGEVVCLDAERERIAAQPDHAPAGEVEPRSAAYVLYTSGSTGTPKGVVVEHASLGHFIASMRAVFAPRPGEVSLAMVSFAFDIWVFEALLPLACGATVRLLPLERARDGAAVVEELRTAGLMNAVPAHMREIVAAARRVEPGALAGVRWVFSGGEAVPRELWAGMREVFPDARPCVLYGPTETTVLSTSYPVPEEAGAGGVMIGRPLPNARVYVLDASGSPQPVGVPGELYVGGPGVARGYEGSAAQTAERFVPDAFSGEPGARLYRTGDRVRWLAGGELEFLGRLDEQVKVRGFRVELGEVEAVLSGLPEVREATAMVREDVPGEKRLVAYVVPADGAEATGAGLRELLAARLPEYMVPAAVVPLEALPLTPNGKVDRRALPAPAWTGGAGEAVVPRDELETVIAGIFAEVLDVPEVGVRDGFFDLGGHSLVAVQLIYLVEKATGVRLPMESVFKAPTVEGLAEEVRRGGGATSLLVPMRSGGSRAPLFLVHPGGGNLMAYVRLARKLDPEQPVYGLRSRGIERDEKPNWTIEEMARDYLAAVREVKPSGPYRLGGWSLGGVVAFEMARQLEAAGETVERLVLIDSRSPRLEDPDGTMPRDELQVVMKFAEDLGVPAHRLPVPDEEPGDGAEVAYLREVLRLAASAGLVPDSLDLARMQRLYGIFRINLQAMHEYRPGEYGGGITLLRAQERGVVKRLLGRKSNRWEQVARGGVEVRPVPGNHYSMLHEANVETLAREVERALG
ncbi:MAG: amino acid adenylation domain-containing protein, partial [Gemmatimonadota bacterium]